MVVLHFTFAGLVVFGLIYAFSPSVVVQPAIAAGSTHTSTPISTVTLTPMPTQQPTQSPQLPTKQPTQSPQLPTRQPTQSPQLPTKQPTQSPQQPTQQPTPVQRPLLSTRTQSNTVSATGQAKTRGTQATGSIRIDNLSGRPLHLDAYTTLTNQAECIPPGLKISLDRAVDVPGQSPVNSPPPQAIVPIHVVQPGTAGNIQDPQDWRDCSEPAFYVSVVSATAILSAYDINGGFTGGTDPQPYIVVQQSDIDNAATPLQISTTSDAQKDIQQQLQFGEHFVSNPQCTSNVTSDHAANTQALTVMVTVSTTCKATAST